MMEMQLMPIKGVLRIPGKDNPADYGSRSHKPDADGDVSYAEKATMVEDSKHRPTLGEREYDNAAKQGKFDNSITTVSLTQAETVFEQENAGDNDTSIVKPPQRRYKFTAKTMHYSPEAKAKIFKSCHGGTAGCWGVRKTYLDIMNVYPGNDMSYAEVARMVELCPSCQKRRLTSMKPGSVMKPIKRVVGPYGPHEAVSIDGAPVSCPGPDEDGHTGFNLVKNQGTKVINIHPYKEKTDEEAANALLLTRIRSGPFKIVISDTGSDFTAKTVANLNKFVGAQHQLTHVRRPQATATEPDIKEAKRFMVSIAEHEGLRHRWGSPRVIAIAEYLINSAPDTETGISPYDLLYGRRDSSVFDIFKKEIDDTTDDLNQSEYIKVLRKEFALVQSLFLKAQQERAKRITIENTASPQNKFQVGDFVFYHIEKLERENTFQARKLGPYEVTSPQSKNDLTITSLVTGATRVTDVSDVSLFCRISFISASTA